MKILIIGPSWIGDMMMSQSLCRTLKSQYPEATIDVMAPAWCRPLLSHMPEVNAPLVMPVGHGKIDLLERYRLGKRLRLYQYDRAYVLPNSFKSALIPFFAEIRQRIGWRGEMRYGLINDRRVLNKKAFPRMVDRYVALAYDKSAVKTAENLPHPLLFPRLSVSEQEKSDTLIEFLLPPDRPLIGFCPGAEFGPAKRWPDYHYASLAQILIKEGYRILLLGSSKEQAIGEKIFQSLNADERVYCNDFTGKTLLRQAVCLLSLCEAVVTNDSGLMHIAAALDCPLVALYGPSSPEFTPPLSNKVKIIRLIEGYHKIRKGESGLGHHQSLIDIHPSQVWEALQDLLQVYKGK